jgi:hypothetical protein
VCNGERGDDDMMMVIVRDDMCSERDIMYVIICVDDVKKCWPVFQSNFLFGGTWFMFRLDLSMWNPPCQLQQLLHSCSLLLRYFNSDEVLHRLCNAKIRCRHKIGRLLQSFPTLSGNL